MASKPAELRRVARLLKALGHRDRLRIMAVLVRREACVCELTAWLGLRQATVSQHLSILRRVGAVRGRRQGARVYYRAAHPQVARLLQLLGVEAPELPAASAAASPSDTVSAAKVGPVLPAD